MAPLHADHRELLPHVEALRAVADAVGTAPPERLVALVDDSLVFLTQHLIPHAQAEEAVLYPAVQKVLGSPRATATMSRDHEEVGRLTAELQNVRARPGAAEAASSTAAELRRILYGLYTLIKVHFAKEEEVYLPLLEEHLTPGEAEAMFTEMQRSATAAE